MNGFGDAIKRFCSAVSGHVARGASRVRQWIADLGVFEAALDVMRENRTLVILALSAIISSLAGYLIGGLSFFNALYASAALFFVNPVDDASNVLIMLGKFLSLVFAGSVILNVVSYALRLAGHYRLNRYDDSTAVYTDNAWGEQLAEGLKHGYIAAQEKHGGLENARHHIFMYSDDMDNLSLYAANREQLRRDGARAYIMLSSTDAFLLGGETDAGTEGPRYFNVYDMLAREYWRRHSLYDAVNAARGEAIRVAVVGYGEVGQAICKYAVLNNVYRLNQAIEYHVWGCKPYQAAFLQGIDMMTGDRIVPHAGNWMDELALLAGMDRVILAERDNTESLQQLLYTSTDAEMHCYTQSQTELTELYAQGAGRLVGFGDTRQILTAQNIKQDMLYRDAKLLNYDYVLRERAKAGENVRTELPDDYEKEMESAWRGLSGFHKGSNIARADHLEIEAMLSRDGLDGEIPELEHIRWCRFHFYNHWSYAPERDNAHRRHNLLLRELPEGFESKDKVFNEGIAKMLGKGATGR